MSRARNIYALLILLSVVLSGGCVSDSTRPWESIEKELGLRKGLDIPQDVHGGLPNFESSVAFIIVKDNEPKYYIIKGKYWLQEIDFQTLEQDTSFLVYLDKNVGWEVVDLVASSVAPKNDYNFFIACEESDVSALLRIEVRRPADHPNHAKLTVKSDGNLELVYSGKIKNFSSFEDSSLRSEITELMNSDDGFSIFIYGDDVSINDYLKVLGGVRLYTDCNIYVDSERSRLR